MKKQIVSPLATALLLLGPVNANAAWEKVAVNDTQRDIKVHIPEGLPEDAPLVIACHGMNQSADWHDSNSKWTAVADTARFALVFPEAINKSWDISGNRDTDFVCAIIDYMHANYRTSISRVYMTGFSMGGMLTYHCANRIPDRIAAYVPVSGYPMGDKSAYGPRPVPIMHVHGTTDDVCVYGGVEPTLDNWIKRNGCNATPVAINPYPETSQTSNTTMYIWGNGTDGVEVRHLCIPDKGHWQSEDPRECLTSVEAWNFMKRWSLPSAD